MTTTPPLSDVSSAMAAPAIDARDYDPFHSAGPTHHRFSHFNAQLFALGPNASPAQAKRALEAHLAETDRRMEEAGKLGTALVQQRNELTERLKEVEKLQTEGELSDDLRQKLVEIERDYNEVARESARAFLPKSRVPSNEAAAGSPFVPEGKGGKRSVSPSKFEAQATGSPTKLSVPNRKIRNQPSHRIHDIEFAAEISTSLIAQVRNLQGLLAEKEEDLRDIRAENSKLEYEVEGFQQRLRALDDNEHRYKDENWNLETQVHEFMAKEKEATDREKKLTQALNILQAEKNAGQRELDEIKLTHSKLIEEHTAAVKHHDIELGTAKRTMVMGESERAAMQKKIDELAGQNTELAKAVSVSIRGRKLERDSVMGMSEDDFHTAQDNSTPEQSPPPSPIKGTPRHSMLESETLKTSLAHAQRTIQSLRTNVHREKTEKMETRRLLQEARDEIEKMRTDPIVPTRRARKTESREFKKPTPRLLGGLRSARSEIFTDDPNWEDQPDILPHPVSSPISRESTILFDPVLEQPEQFETAHETSDAAFETANENATETDDFQTGAEEFSSDGAETETESPLKRRTLRGRPPNLFSVQRTGSMDSTASTEDEDFPYEHMRTPPSLPPVHARFPLRVSRGAFRRSRNASEDQIFQSSPASLPPSSNIGTPQQPVQSLAAELGDFDGSDNESNMSATPSRRSTRGRTMSPPPALPPLPRVIMVDSGMMTEPVHELAASLKDAVNADRPLSMHTVVNRFSLGSEYSDVGAKLAEFPSPPLTSPKRDVLALSTVHSHDVEPLPELDTHAAEIATLRTEHAEQLERLIAENVSAHESAMAILKSQHADEFTAANDAHARELESLRSHHADTTDKTMAEIETSHLREIESIKSRHAEEISQRSAEALASHSQELELLKALHAQQLTQKETESQAIHAASLESLKTAHGEELSQKEVESAAALASALEALKAAHASDLESFKNAHSDELSRKETESTAALASALEGLKVAHAEELRRMESASNATYATEIEALKAAHARELFQKETESATVHSSVLEDLKLTHADQLVRKESEAKAIHKAELGALKALHAKEISESEAKLRAAASTELEALKANYAEELSNFKVESAAVQAAELTALVETHTIKIDAAKKELSEAHAREFESLKSSHAEQIHEAQRSMQVAQSEQLEGLKVAHLQEIDAIKKSINTIHHDELESLRAAHAKQIEDTKIQLTTAQAIAIASLTDSHNKQLDDTKSTLHAAHSHELVSLQASHADQLENLRKEKDATHAAAIATLIGSHNKQIDEVKHTINTTHAQEFERLKASHTKDLEELGKERDTAHATAVAAIFETHSKQLDTQKADGEAAMSREIVALKATHAHELETLNSEHAAAHAKELEGFKAALAKQMESSKMEGDATHTQQIEALNAAHSEIIEAHKRDAEIAQSHAVDALKSSYERQIETLNSENAAARTKELELLTTRHLDEMKDLRNEHAAARSRELEELTNNHADELKTLKSGYETEHSQLREQLIATHSKELEALRQQMEAMHSRDSEVLRTQHVAALAALNSEHEASVSQLRQDLGVTHSNEVEAIRQDFEATHSKELESLRFQHLAAVEALNSEHEAAKSQLHEQLGVAHLKEIEAVRQDSGITYSNDLESLRSQHAEVLAALESEHEAAHSQLREELSGVHSAELEGLRRELGATHSKEMESLGAGHAKNLEALKSEHEATIARQLKELEDSHAQKMADLRQEREQAKSNEIIALGISHAQTIDALKSDHEAQLAHKMQEIAESHAQTLEKLGQQNESDHSRELIALNSQHQSDLESLRNELESVRRQQLADLESAHATALTSLRAEHQSVLQDGLSNLEAKHSKALDDIKNERQVSQVEALNALGVEHSQQLDQLKGESDATLVRELDLLKGEHARVLEAQAQESDATLLRELDALKAQHREILQSQINESNVALTQELNTLKAEHKLILESHIGERTAEKENMFASHALELEALRASLTVVPPVLGYSRLNSVETEPVELPEIKSPRREAFIIPQDNEPMTPQARSNGRLDRQGKATDVTIIAEDDTRQSPSVVVRSETPDSQRPFKEITANTDARSLRKPAANSSHQGSQTTLTADGLDRLMKGQDRQSREAGALFGEGDAVTPSTVRRRNLSTDSFGSVMRARQPGVVAASELPSIRRPGSSASTRSATQNMPPLPLNHREVIEAARSHSAHGGKGTMGPPLLPASAYRPSSSRPETPNSVARGTLTPRTGRTPGYADVQPPIRAPMRSRQSSMSSFASEIDTRFNIPNGMGMEPSGFGSNTDPRMIQAVTQTMIGEYLWKYTRKTGRGEMSENRHRRFFWVHPYTRALYWSDSDPAAGGRGETRAKSVPIEAVRVVADDNPMPPGLHRKSLVVIAPGRTIKFTCTTGQRHETWFNALSYLLLRSGDENKQDAEEVAGNITQDDIEEFNPSMHRSSENGQRPRPPPSLSSYNSRTTRNESPAMDASMAIPTLTPTHEKEGARSGTFGRKLSGYWKSSSLSRGTLNSLRSRSYQPYDSAIYEASEVPDSAEDLRQIIEQQDRESDRLENVRACCDGKHDVGTLSHTTKRGRLPSFQPQSHTHTHPGLSASNSAVGSMRSRP